MRRAAVQVLRSARRPIIRAAHKSKSTAFQQHALSQRSVTARHGRELQILSSSMYFRNFSVALVSTLVASGAYFTYRGIHSQPDLADSGASLNQKSAYSTSSPIAGLDEVPRKALFIEQGQLYTGQIKGEGPISKQTDDQGRKILEMMTPEQATQRIRRNEESYFVSRGKGVVRYDVVQLASNDPIEDDHAEKIVEVPKSITPPSEGAANNDWMFWGVFDGHSGWTTSAKLRQTLISYVARELNTTYAAAQKSSWSPLPTPSSIDDAIKKGFLALDHSIVHQSAQEVMKSQSKVKAASLLAPALSGSCALLSFYDSGSGILRVACTGDSRAVLGRRSATARGKWTAHPLSVDQTGGNADEEARMRAEHPGEPHVIRNGRVLGGLEPTRAFGDAVYKWSKDVQDKLKKEFFGRTYNPLMQTPPYVTAEPVVTSTRVEPTRGDFVVMATDGLWEMLTNEEVVGLVGQWIEKNPAALSKSTSNLAIPSHSSSADKEAQSWISSFFGSSKRPSDLPVEHDDKQGDQSGQRAPIRQQQWGLEPTTSEKNSTPSSSRFVVKDKNVATHLIRNALGGADEEMMCALLTLPSPYSRRYRDDLTVEVIFFGDEHTVENKVTVNEQATSKISDSVKPKL